MFKQLKVCLVGALAFVLQFLSASDASARSPLIEASAFCANGSPVIAYTATSWNVGQVNGANTLIYVEFNTVLVGTGAFEPPNYSFSGEAGAQAGQVVEVTVRAIGNWGDAAAGGQFASVSVTVPSDCVAPAGVGRFTGGGKQITLGGLSVTRGLTIHCDRRLSNNLEVNWGGNRFHMTEHLTTVACTDDPGIVQTPPRAPLDTLIGVGSGRYNGADGYTIYFTLVDAGEPGSNDMMAILIFETTNPSNVVLNVEKQLMTTGNLQAHFDQPHKSR